jgi:hypothetical protein
VHRAQIPGSAVHQRRFGSVQGMRAELERIEADVGDPLIEEAGVLTCREVTTVTATGKREVAGLRVDDSEILVDGLPRLLG